MLQQNPLVTVLIDNYNYEQYLSCAIDSALGQTYQSVEVIVVDDGSKDNSRAVIESYGDRIKSVFKVNGGQGSAFNAGLPEITGEIVCLLDADDVFVPDKLEKVVSLFQSMPEVDWVFHALQDVNAAGDPIEVSPDHGSFETQVLDLRGMIRQGQELPYLPPTSALCFRRSILQQILPMPEALRISSDNFLCLSAAFLGKGYLYGQALSQYRIHGKISMLSGRIRGCSMGKRTFARPTTCASGFLRQHPLRIAASPMLWVKLVAERACIGSSKFLSRNITLTSSSLVGLGWTVRLVCWSIILEAV
ncbi:MAG: glycosyltransferase [Alkalinema sp. RU_4_3]|nr:glycosyltransferase [Alkalinema sp. RU_4_3]